MARTQVAAPSAWQVARRPHLLDDGVRADCVRQLYTFQPIVPLLSAGLLATLGTFILAGIADPLAALLCAASVIGTLALLPLQRAYRRSGPQEPAWLERWATLYLWLSLGYASAIGALVVRAVSLSNDPLTAVTMVVFSLAAAATTLRNFVWPRVLFLQLVLLIVLPAVAIGIVKGGAYWILGPAAVALAFNFSQVGSGLFRANLALFLKDAELKAEALRANRSEQRFRLAVQATRDWVWEWDLSSDQITRANPDGIMHDFAASELAEPGRGWRELVHPDDLAETRESLTRAVADTATTWAAQYRYLRRDGSYAHVLDRAVIVRDETGRAIQLVGATSDITQLVEVAAALRESEEHYRHRVELDPHNAWATDGAGKIIEMSRHWTDQTGLSMDEALGHGWFRVVHPEDRARVQRDLEAAAQRKRPVETPIRFRMTDGAYRWYRVRAYPRLDEAGNILRWYGYSEDMHEQVLAQKELAASRARFETIFDQALVGIALSMPGEGIIIANERFASILGRPAAALVGLTISDITHPDDLHWNVPLFRQHAETGEPFISDKRYVTADGSTVWCRASVSFVKGADGASRLAIIVIEDISERKRAETRAEELQSELVRVSRATAMGAMGTAIAHEMNQPLAAITNYVTAARLFLNKLDHIPDGVRDALEAAARESLRAGEVIRRLRRLTDRTRTETGPNDLAALVRSAHALAFVGGADIGIRSEMRLASNVTVLVDRVQIEQVLINLFRNAVEAMRGQPVCQLRVETTIADRTARVDVYDTGTGLTAEIRDHLFAPYRTTKDGGMGIGLSICHKIIEAHGGRIWAEDRAEGGTCFSFTLPLAVGDRAVEADPPRIVATA